MSLETVSAFASVLTVLIVGATAVAALVQLRHLRAGNQINAILTIGDKFLEPKFVEARELVRTGVGSAMEDPRFRESVIARARGESLARYSAEQLALLAAINRVGNMFEEVGCLVKNGVVDEWLLLDEYVTQVVGTWARLEPYIALTREAAGDIGIWDNFEYLTVRAREFLVAHQTTYPKGTPRIALKNPWPLS
jgi:hypothetical protein